MQFYRKAISPTRSAVHMNKLPLWAIR